jgi:uncharacterized cupin superfamily protein
MGRTLMAKIDVKSVRVRTGSGYPAPFDQPVLARTRQALGDAAGLTQFGVNLLALPPGSWSSQRPWHSGEDEFVWVLAGEVVLVTDAGEEVLRAGECAGFAKGLRDGHHLVNRSETATAVCLEVGTRADVDYVGYPDIDMIFDSSVGEYAHRDGTLYPSKTKRAVQEKPREAPMPAAKRRRPGGR